MYLLCWYHLALLVLHKSLNDCLSKILASEQSDMYIQTATCLACMVLASGISLEFRRSLFDSLSRP